MAKTIQDIQEVIKQRATNKLHADLQTMSNTINGMKLLGRNGDSSADSPKVYQKVRDGQSEKFQEYQAASVFYVSENSNGRFSGSLLMDKIKEYWLPTYIENETKSFFDRLDQVEQQVQDLMGVNANRDDY